MTVILYTKLIMAQYSSVLVRNDKQTRNQRPILSIIARVPFLASSLYLPMHYSQSFLFRFITTDVEWAYILGSNKWTSWKLHKQNITQRSMPTPRRYSDSDAAKRGVASWMTQWMFYYIVRPWFREMPVQFLEHLAHWQWYKSETRQCNMFWADPINKIFQKSKNIIRTFYISQFITILIKDKNNIL